ncbi:TPA: AbrB family transcriptional regulator [Bacillus mycoides]|nr:AbrB family transcriptional regulator [Bacillus mycoides]HDR7630898.1 AbrB family transcriptional regulator [Bacillus mycoides]
MKFTGIIRHVDEKGRISIPMELRNIIGMQEDTVPIEFIVVDEMLILQRYRDACAITGKISRRNISLANGQIKVHTKEVKQLIKELKEYLGKNRLI